MTKSPLNILLIAISLFLSSCEKESLEFFPEEITVAEEVVKPGEEPKKDLEINPETTPEGIPDEELDLTEINSTPCNFQLNNLAANSTTTIDCTIDLRGGTVNLPSSTTLVFKNGQIINGTLNFADNGIIDGDLLNVSLNIAGNTRLSNNTFNFITERWEIESGEVTDDIALQNKINFQKSIDLSKRLGATVFQTDILDAFFKIGLGHGGQEGLSNDAIHLPSNFEFNMTDETFLRVQPNRFPWSILVSTYRVENVIVTGGNLIGDRFKHDYSDFIDGDNISRATHEWPTLLLTAGSKNITFERVTMRESTGDGFVVGAAGFRTNNAPFNDGIYFRSCIVDACRRNNISVTDGENIFIENNQIINAGLGREVRTSPPFNSDGVNPRFGLDVEPYVEYSSFTFESRIQFEWVDTVTIRGNDFINNAAGSIVVFSGDNVLIDRNKSDHSISLNETTGSVISNNQVVARSNVFGRSGITTSDFRRYVDFVGPTGTFRQYALNNNVFNNTVRGFTTGLRIRGGKSEVTGNTLIDNEVGLVTDRVENIDIHNNVYRSGLPNSTGIVLGFYANNLKIYNENFDVKARYLFINNLNEDSKFGRNVRSYKATISNSTFKGGKTSRVFNAFGLSLINNTINTGTEIINSEDIIFNTNRVTAQSVDGVRLDNVKRTAITNNIFNLSNGYEKVEITNEVAGAGNVISGN